MAGPGSRLERIGTVFSRVQGLLRSGAIKPSDKPVWYDVYAAFPPSSLKPTRQGPVRKLLYLEDVIRARFYKTYGNATPINMMTETDSSPCQRFVGKYFELEEQGVSVSELFEATSEALKAEGLKLKTLQQIEQERSDFLAARLKAESEKSEELLTSQKSAKELFGNAALNPAQLADMEDTIDDDLHYNPADDKDG